MMSKLGINEGSQNYTSMLFFAGVALILSGSNAMENGWLLCWCGIGFVLVGLAYARFGVSVFGKKSDGGRIWLNRIILFPFLVLNVAIWHLRHRVLSREDICNEVAPGIWLGRRAIDGELPANVTTVVDLTAEFSATPQVRKLNYICVPTLDGLAPSDHDFHSLMQRLSSGCQTVYIHCAAGHGRSATVAVALLVTRGLAKDLTEAESIVKIKRPRISIKQPQRELLHRWFDARQNVNAPENGTPVQKHHVLVQIISKWFQQTLNAAASLFFWIGGIAAGCILIVGFVGKTYSDYQKDPMSTIISLSVAGSLMCWSLWISRNGDQD